MHYKKHHYVPKFYLKYFSAIQVGDRKPLLWVYDKEGGEPRKQSPAMTAAINDLYKTSAPGISANALEIAFSKQEGIAAPILLRWGQQGAIPTIDEILEVASFIAFLYLRNPKTAKWYEAMAKLMAAEKSKMLACDATQFDKFWNWYVAKEKIPSPLTKEQVREKILAFDEHFIVKFDPQYVTFSPLQYADDIFKELKKMYWCLCSAPSGSAFITSDSPVVVRFRKNAGLAFGGGFGHPTAQVTFPISPKVCLYLSRTFNCKATLVKSTVVKKLNRRTAINAERYVFASERITGIEKLVRKYAFTRNQPRVDTKEFIEHIRNRMKTSQNLVDET